MRLDRHIGWQRDRQLGSVKTTVTGLVLTAAIIYVGFYLLVAMR